jgi:CRP/FNR family transcriptional regulator, anaerobic regulatory protein
VLTERHQKMRPCRRGDTEALATPFATRLKGSGVFRCGFDDVEDASGSHLGDWTTLANLRILPAGRALIWAGAPFRSLYIVCAGAFKSTSCSTEGEARILAFHLPGALIGFDGLDTRRCICDVEALVPSTVRALSLEQLLFDARSAPEVFGKLLRLVSHEMVGDQAHLAMMGHTKAIARLARFLRGLSEGLVRARHEDPDCITLPMSRADLANYLGLAVETISRLFSQLDRDGVASVDRQSIRLLDHRALAELCGDASPGQQSSRAHTRESALSHR